MQDIKTAIFTAGASGAGKTEYAISKKEKEPFLLHMDIDDIRDNDSDFLNAPHFEFIYRPFKRIVGKFGKQDSSLYTEVIKYSTLLKRAKKRNEIFIKKLGLLVK